MYQNIVVLLFSLAFSHVNTGQEIASSTFEHGIYISVIEVEKSAGDFNGSVKVKVFVDDLEDAIHNHSNNKKSYRSGCQSNESELKAYFEEHLVFNVNKEPKKIELLNCERLEDSLWLNFKFDQKTTWNKVDIVADYFMELFPTQSNIVSIDDGTGKQFSRLNKSQQSAEFTFSH